MGWGAAKTIEAIAKTEIKIVGAFDQRSECNILILEENE